MKNKEYLATLSNEELAPYLVMSPCRYACRYGGTDMCGTVLCVDCIAMCLEEEHVD